MPQIMDKNGLPALLPFTNQNITGDSAMLKAMASTTRFSTPIIDNANEISPMGDRTMRFLQGLDLGKQKLFKIGKNFFTGEKTLKKSVFNKKF